jgi:hypothetical protein
MASKPKVGAPKGNQNRVKGNAPMTARISFRCHDQTKAITENLCDELGITTEELYSKMLGAIMSGKLVLKRK